MSSNSKICNECESEFLTTASKMENLCPECAHRLYGYENCEHLFENGRCTHCLWNGETSNYLKNQKVNKKSLSVAGNLEVPSYKTLRESGYRITKKDGVWTAENDFWILNAESQIELLGLASLVEKKGDNWRVTDDEIDEFLKLNK